MAADTMTTLQEGLQTDYRDHLQNTIPLKSFLYQRIRQRGKKYNTGGISGTANWSVDKEFGYGAGGHAEGGDLTTAYPDGFDTYTATPARWSIAFEFTTDAKAFTRKASTRFIQEISKRKIKVVRNIAQHMLATRIFMNGDTILGQINGAPAGNVVTVDNPGVMWFRRGMRVTARDLSTGGSEQLTGGGDSGKVVAVDRINNTITLTDATGAADDDFLALADLYDVTDMQGLQSLIGNTGTVQGVNRATAGNEFAEAWVSNLGGAVLTEMDFQQMNDYIRDFSPNAEVAEEFVTDSASVRALFLAIGDRHRFPDNKELVSGFQTLMIHTSAGPRPLHSDPYCNPGDIYALRPSEFVSIWPEGEVGGTWLDADGSILKLKTGSSAGTRAAAWQGWWEMRPQIAVDDFQSQGLINNFISA